MGRNRQDYHHHGEEEHHNSSDLGNIVGDTDRHLVTHLDTYCRDMGLGGRYVVVFEDMAMIFQKENQRMDSPLEGFVEAEQDRYHRHYLEME